MRYIYSLIYIAMLTLPLLLIVCVLWFGWRKLFRRAKHQPSWVIQSILLILPLFWILLLLVQRFMPQRSGFIAMSHILLPHLFLFFVLLVPFALLPRTYVLRLALAGCACVFVLVFVLPLRWSSPSVASDTPMLSVLHWNAARTIEGDQRQRLRALLLNKPADVVIVAEAYWKWLREDPDILSHYPHQLVHATHSESGLVLLTSYPITAHKTSDLAQAGQGWARFLWVELTVDQQSVAILALHPEAPFGTHPSCRFIPCFDPTRRDLLLTHARTLIEPALAQGVPLLVVGDLNTTEREAMYTYVLAGLQDSHSQIGTGVGSTWGLVPQLGWRIPLLRIDHMLTSASVVPTAFTTDCQLRGSDHCIVKGAFAIRATVP